MISKRIVNLIFIVLVGCLLFAACSQQKPLDNNGDTTTTEEKDNTSTIGTGRELKIENVLFITGEATGTWMVVGAGIAEKANDFFEGYPINAVPGPGSVGGPSVVFAGDAELGMSYGPFLLAAKEGKAPYDKPMANLRAVAALTPTVVHFFADTNPPVNTVSELFEKEIPITLGVPPTGQGSNYVAQIIFSTLGYSELEDIKEYGGKIYYASGSNLSDAWKDRHINAVINTYNVPASSIQEMLMGRNGTILNIEGKIKDALVEEKGFAEYSIPSGTYEGQDNEVNTVALPIIIFTREDISEDIIYYLTKAIYENKAYLEGVHSSFKEFDPKKMTEGLGIEMHKGAEKYYKEVGLVK